MRRITTYSISLDDGREPFRPRSLKKAIARLKVTPNAWLWRYVWTRTRCIDEPILIHEDGRIYRCIRTLEGDISTARLKRAGVCDR